MTVSFKYMENLTFEEQVQAFYSNDIVLSPHGSALVNLLFSIPRSAVIECNPPYYMEPWYTNTALISRAHYLWLSTYYPYDKRNQQWKAAEKAYYYGYFTNIYRKYVNNLVNPPVFAVLSAVRDAVEYLKRWRFVYEVNDKWSPVFFN